MVTPTTLSVIATLSWPCKNLDASSLATSVLKYVFLQQRGLIELRHVLSWHTVLLQSLVTLCVCTRGACKVFGSVIVVIKKNCLILTSRHLSDSKGQQICRIWQKNWPHYATNRVAQPMIVTNSVFLLAIIATPIDCAHY